MYSIRTDSRCRLAPITRRELRDWSVDHLGKTVNGGDAPQAAAQQDRDIVASVGFVSDLAGCGLLVDCQHG